MFKRLRILLLFLLPSVVMAQPAAYTPTEIMLLGSFHFDNPGLDVAKFENANVLSATRQKEIQDVVEDLKRFKPDVVFIEATPAKQPYYDSLFEAYKQGQYQLQANEIYQLAFPVGRDLRLPRLHCIDFRETKFPFDSLVKVMSAANQMDLLNFVKESIDSIERRHNDQLKNFTIKEIFQESNSRRSQAFAVGMYFEFLRAGDKDNHIGSFLASEWWRRNMVIYENMLKRLSGNEKKILVIFGSSHTALLHEFIKYNSRFKIVEVSKVLR